MQPGGPQGLIASSYLVYMLCCSVICRVRMNVVCQSGVRGEVERQRRSRRGAGARREPNSRRVRQSTRYFHCQVVRPTTSCHRVRPDSSAGKVSQPPVHTGVVPPANDYREIQYTWRLAGGGAPIGPDGRTQVDTASCQSYLLPSSASIRSQCPSVFCG